MKTRVRVKTGQWARLVGTLVVSDVVDGAVRRRVDLGDYGTYWFPDEDVTLYCDYCSLGPIGADPCPGFQIHCQLGAHCTTTGADCAAAASNYDHSDRCCLCSQRLDAGRDPITLAPPKRLVIREELAPVSFEVQTVGSREESRPEAERVAAAYFGDTPYVLVVTGAKRTGHRTTNGAGELVGHEVILFDIDYEAYEAREAE